jgi:hypothetical protein
MKLKKIKNLIDYVLIVVLLVNIFVNIYKIIDTKNMVHRNTTILEELKKLNNK